MKIPHDTLILVADGEKALFLRNEGDEDFPNFEVERKKIQENPSTEEQGADRPGRMHDYGPGQKSAVDDTDWHALEKERFAAELAEMLFKRANANSFDRLIVCAAPQTLGELRDHYHKIVEERLIGEIDKDLTNLPIDQIEDHLKKAA